MSNVVPFPKTKRPTPNDSSEQVHQDIENAHRLRAEFALDIIVENIYHVIDDYNIPIDNENEQTLKSTALLIEALRSLLFGVSNIPHPLQHVAYSLFNVSVAPNGDSQISINTSDDVIVTNDNTQKVEDPLRNA